MNIGDHRQATIKVLHSCLQRGSQSTGHLQGQQTVATFSKIQGPSQRSQRVPQLCEQVLSSTSSRPANSANFLQNSVVKSEVSEVPQLCEQVLSCTSLGPTNSANILQNSGVKSEISEVRQLCEQVLSSSSLGPKFRGQFRGHSAVFLRTQARLNFFPYILLNCILISIVLYISSAEFHNCANLFKKPMPLELIRPQSQHISRLFLTVNPRSTRVVLFLKKNRIS